MFGLEIHDAICERGEPSTKSGIHTLPQVLPTTNQLQLSSPKRASPWKTNMTMEKQPFEDISPI